MQGSEKILTYRKTLNIGPVEWAPGTSCLKFWYVSLRPVTKLLLRKQYLNFENYLFVFEIFHRKWCFSAAFAFPVHEICQMSSCQYCRLNLIKITIFWQKRPNIHFMKSLYCRVAIAELRVWANICCEF